MLNPVARDFILYCIGHDDHTFPMLYDKMCWVASHHLFRGMDYEGLKKIGLSLSLVGIEDTYRMVDVVLAQRQGPQIF